MGTTPVGQNVDLFFLLPTPEKSCAPGVTGMAGEMLGEGWVRPGSGPALSNARGRLFLFVSWVTVLLRDIPKPAFQVSTPCGK